MYKIARRYGTDVSTIKVANNLNRRYRIKTGETLLVPVGLPFGKGDVRLISLEDSELESL